MRCKPLKNLKINNGSKQLLATTMTCLCQLQSPCGQHMTWSSMNSDKSKKPPKSVNGAQLVLSMPSTQLKSYQLGTVAIGGALSIPPVHGTINVTMMQPRPGIIILDPTTNETDNSNS